MRRRMIVTVTFVAALLLLSVNYGVERLFDESEQVAQWASLSWRGGVAMMVMACVCMVGIGSASQMLILGLRDCKSRRTEEHIVGKVTRLLWSFEPYGGRLRWKRVMKGVE